MPAQSSDLACGATDQGIGITGQPFLPSRGVIAAHTALSVIKPKSRPRQGGPREPIANDTEAHAATTPTTALKGRNVMSRIPQVLALAFLEATAVPAATLTEPPLATNAGSSADAPAARGLVPLVDTIGWAYPKGRYMADYGFWVAGENSSVEYQYWEAVPFTPKADAVLYEVDLALHHLDGFGGIVVSITEDANGVPGTALVSYKVAHPSPEAPECCGLVRLFNDTGLPVRGGTQYWLSLTTEARSQERSLWNFSVVDQVCQKPYAYNDGTSWSAYTSNVTPAFAIFGK
jgi:hypothetical protein